MRKTKTKRKRKESKDRERHSQRVLKTKVVYGAAIWIAFMIFYQKLIAFFSHTKT